MSSRMRALSLVAALCLAVGAIAGCGSAGHNNASQTVVVLDPGHNGANATHLAEINRLVPTGRGQMKPCNTTGTSTVGGYTEHAFNWDVANRVRADIRSHGITVVMTRQNDDSVGPCVDQRAAIGNRADAAAVVSIHADNAAPTGHGFHINYSSPPLNAAQRTQSPQLARDLRDAMVAAGFPPSNYRGVDGLYPRSDLTGLNLSDRPTALVECANMRNPTEAAQLVTPAARQRYADAISAGILHYLGKS